MKWKAQHYPNLEQLSRCAAESVCSQAKKAIQERDPFTMSLSGGKIPRLLG